MNILLANLHKFIGYSGGIEHVLSDMAQAFTVRGHKVTVVMMDEKDGTPFFPLPDNVEFYNLCHLPGEKAVALSRGLKLVREIIRPFSREQARNVNYKLMEPLWPGFRKILDKTKPDVIISSREPTGRLLLSHPEISVPVISMLHNDPDEIFMHSPEEEKKMLCRSASIQVLLPSFIPKAEKYLSYKHFTAIPNAVPEAGVQAHPGEKKEEYVITSVGRLTGRTKRQHLLIEAFALLSEDFPQWKVNFWGADYDRAYVMKLKKLIEGKHLENQVFLKGTTRDMQSVWKETDIFSFPSHHEGFPLALTEAMAAGIPAVGYASCPAVNELIVSGENGYLAEDGVEALAESLKALMLDPAKRESFGRKARQGMEAYRPECVWNSWEMLIKDTVERTKNTKG